MVITLGLLGLLAAAPTEPLELEVFVPLCDNAQIACGRGGAGDPRSLTANLYWGAAYGAERFLTRAPGFRVRSRHDGPPNSAVLRELVMERAPARGERAVRLVLQSLGVRPVVLTRTMMAPEAYLLEALAGAVARHGPTEAGDLRTALVSAYARYQRISPRAAGTVFARPPVRE